MNTVNLKMSIFDSDVCLLLRLFFDPVWSYLIYCKLTRKQLDDGFSFRGIFSVGNIFFLFEFAVST